MSKKPWIDGPRELLQHGLDHLKLDTDFDRRMAIICIDNAVEVMIKTYFGLPKRATGLKLTRNQVEQLTGRSRTFWMGLKNTLWRRFKVWILRILNGYIESGISFTTKVTESPSKLRRSNSTLQ